jgi:hypothetical protein
MQLKVKLEQNAIPLEAVDKVKSKVEQKYTIKRTVI